jgi:Flp pilus assembly protein TadG
MENTDVVVPKPRRRKRQLGQSLAEFAIVVPVFLILVFGVVDFSLGLKAWLTVTNASREGARVLVLGQTCSQVTTQAQNVASSLHPSVTVTITPNTCTGVSGDAMSVKVTYTYTSVTPLGHFTQLLTGPITMSSTSTMRHE